MSLVSFLVESRLRALPLILGMLVAGLLYVAGTWLEGLEAARVQAESERALHDKVSHLRDQLASELSDALVEVSALADWTTVQGGVSDANFADFSRRMISRHHALISTTDLPGDIIRRTYPENPTLVGLDVGRHPLQGIAVQRMKESGLPIVSGPIQLKQGGQGLILRAPVFKAKTFEHIGHVSLVFDIGMLRTMVEDFAEKNDLQIEVRDENQLGLTSNFDLLSKGQSRKVPDTESVELALDVAQEKWSIVARANKSALSESPILRVIALFTWLFSLVCGLGAFWVLNFGLALRASNRLLESSQRAALAARDAKSAFLANMSHELRTPMNGVIATAQMLEDSPLTKEQRELVTTIADSGKSLLVVINDILDFSKIESQKLILDPEPTDIFAVVRSVGHLFEPLAKEKKLRFKVECASDLPKSVLLDAQRVRQVLSNMMSNAIKFTERGEVSLSVTTETVSGAPVLAFKMRDTGIGISQPEALFVEFVQAESSTTRRFGGTGLGLVISRRLVEMMGGKMGVDSTPGAGSTFWVYLPMQVVSLEGPSTSEPVGELLPGRALVVDDNHVNRRIADRVLQKFGWSATCVPSARTALDAMVLEQFDLVLMDCSMPEMDGFEATRRIRKLDAPISRVPIIAMTANALAEDKKKCADAGMTDFLAKPLELNAVRKALTRWGPGAAPTGGSAQPLGSLF